MHERSSLITEFGPESRSPQYDKWTESAATHAEQEQEREEVRLLQKGRKILRNSITPQAAKADTTSLCAPHTAASFAAALTLLITADEKM